MNKKILIIKNISREGPGLLQDILNSRKITSDIVDLEAGAEFPAPEKYQAVIVLGGPDSANDQNPKILNELKQIKKIIQLGIPYLGICLGLQLLVKAAGGEVVKSPVKEVGFAGPDGNNFTVELTTEGRKDPLFSGLENSFNVFQLHGETVVLTQEMTLLATGKFCKNQVVRVGKNAYGIQYHFELTSDMFEKWIAEDNDLLQLDKNKLRNDFKKIQIEYTETSKRLLKNFLKIAGFIS